MFNETNRRGQVRSSYQDDKRGQRQLIALLVLFVVVAIIIGALYLVQATTNVTNARDIQLLREQRSRILRENEALRAQNAELGSVDRLVERAATLGFGTAGPDSMQFVVIDGYVYDQPAPTFTPVPMTAIPQTYDDNFAGWVQRQLDRLGELFDRWGEQ